MTLDDIEVGESCTVEYIGETGEMRRRLLDMGITKNTEISVVRQAPLGDPIDVRLRGYNLSLRRADAACIEVERKCQPADPQPGEPAATCIFPHTGCTDCRLLRRSSFWHIPTRR